MNSLSSNSSVNSINNGYHLNNQSTNGQSNIRQLTNEELYATNDVNILKKALAEKDFKINEMTINLERERNLCEMESRLITVAFHDLSFKLNRKTATERCLKGSNQQINQSDNVSNSSSNNLTGSLLSKQRLSTARRLNNLNNNIIN